MPALKILITGGSGLLGQYLNTVLVKQNQILTLYNQHPGNCKNYNSLQIDLTDYKKFNLLFAQFNPDVVVHTAAFTSPVIPDGVSTKEIYKINVNAALNIARQCEKVGCKLIYLSTDLVYAGYRGSMLKEDAKLIPASLYAETKLVAEEKIKETFDNYIILRTALMIGFGLNHSKCHFHQMYNNLKEGKRVKLFQDQYRTPLSLIDAARLMNEIIPLDIKSETINFGGKTRISRTELGELVCNITGFNKNLIDSVPLSSVTQIPQVADVSMNTDKLQSFGITPLGIEEAVNALLTDYNAG
ncbi:MAG: NAD(P)-dependent oxidoreductase [Ignavibacteriaceae bacterium]|nr:NAD(P)-dependent oxidoreductase [Ignavibacteriaceae bacterium]